MIKKFVKRSIALLTLVAFMAMSVPSSYAQSVVLPKPGTMVALSATFTPPLLKGIKVYPDNPFRLDFILDKGNSSDPAEQLKVDSTRLIKYFLASVTVPEKDLWVNLSPYEKDRIVPDAFGQTEMGRDLLAQDYLLKQITASVIYPEGEVGKKFWAKVYAEAQSRYGTTDIPVDTFNKVWIVPEKAVVYENKDAAFVVESKLKVMLESDYVAATQNEEMVRRGGSVTRPHEQDSQEFAKPILREVVIPILEKEVNESRNFAQLRQVYNSLILAVWFKDKVKESIFGKAYVDRDKIAGVAINDKAEKEKIWARYVESFKKGVYNYIKEENDPGTQDVIPRKYFSGGFNMRLDHAMVVTHDAGMIAGLRSAFKVMVLSVALTIAGGQTPLVNMPVKIPPVIAGSVTDRLFKWVGHQSWITFQIFSIEGWNEYLMSIRRPLNTVGEASFNTGTGLQIIRLPMQPREGGVIIRPLIHEISHAIINREHFLGNRTFLLQKVEALEKAVLDNGTQEDIKAFYKMFMFYKYQYNSLSQWIVGYKNGEIDVDELLSQVKIVNRQGSGWRDDSYLKSAKIGFEMFLERGKIQLGEKVVSTSTSNIPSGHLSEDRDWWEKMKSDQKLQDYIESYSCPNSEASNELFVYFVTAYTKWQYFYYFGSTPQPLSGAQEVHKSLSGLSHSGKLEKTDDSKKPEQHEKPVMAEKSGEAGPAIFAVVEQFIIEAGLPPDIVSYDNSMSFALAPENMSIPDEKPLLGEGKPVKADNGGIDLTRDRMGLQVHSGGQGVQFNFDPAMIQQLQNAPGLAPVIIDIQPMTTTVPMFLGLKDDAPAQG